MKAIKIEDEKRRAEIKHLIYGNLAKRIAEKVDNDLATRPVITGMMLKVAMPHKLYDKAQTILDDPSNAATIAQLIDDIFHSQENIVYSKEEIATALLIPNTDIPRAREGVKKFKGE